MISQCTADGLPAARLLPNQLTADTEGLLEPGLSCVPTLPFCHLLYHKDTTYVNVKSLHVFTVHTQGMQHVGKAMHIQAQNMSLLCLALFCHKMPEFSFFPGQCTREAMNTHRGMGTWQQLVLMTLEAHEATFVLYQKKATKLRITSTAKLQADLLSS